MCVSPEESPSGAEKVPDCDVLLEPTLLGPLKGEGCTVSLSQCVAIVMLLFYQHVMFLVLTLFSQPVFPFEKLESATGRTFSSLLSLHLLIFLHVYVC